MKLNESSVKTSINYGINDFEIPNSIVENVRLSKFSNFDINNAQSCKIANLDDELLKLHVNFRKNIKIVESTQKPVFINLNLTQDLAGELNITILENVCAQIVLNINSIDKIYNNFKLKIDVKECAKLDAVIVSCLENNSTNIFELENNLSTDAKLEVSIVDFGSNYSVWSGKSFLKGRQAESCFKLAYLGVNENKLDYNFLKTIYGEQCKCEIEAVGALFDKSFKNFKGTIDFCKGCKKSIGNEKDFCMLLSCCAKSKALPMLLSGEDDISGNHSTAVGRVGNKELFYIMSRGLTKLEAIRLLVKAKFMCVIETIFDEDLKQKIIKKIDEKIVYEE